MRERTMANIFRQKFGRDLAVKMSKIPMFPDLAGFLLVLSQGRPREEFEMIVDKLVESETLRALEEDFGKLEMLLERQRQKYEAIRVGIARRIAEREIEGVE